MSSRARSVLIGLIGVCAGFLTACGGGNGDGNSTVMTTFTGNMASATAAGNLTPRNVQSALSALLLSSASAQGSGVEVCVEGTVFCTELDEDGFFTLSADIAGDVVLVFSGSDFIARLALADVPAGATVRIRNVRCSTTTGTCRADDVDFGVPTVNAAPLCDEAVVRPAVIWPPSHDMVRITIDGVIDPDGDPVDVSATDVFQDEPVTASGGSGNTSPDALLAPLSVRAERDGGGDGRVYTVEFVADDGRGGRCIGDVRLCVPHDQGRGDNCVDSGPLFDSVTP